MKTRKINRSRGDIRCLLARLLGLFLQGNLLVIEFDNWFLARRRLETCTLIIPHKR
jgi:hypothetical protein